MEKIYLRYIIILKEIKNEVKKTNDLNEKKIKMFK